MRFWAVLTILTQAAWFGALLWANTDTDLLCVLMIIAATAALTLAGGVLYQWWLEHCRTKIAAAGIRRLLAVRVNELE